MKTRRMTFLLSGLGLVLTVLGVGYLFRTEVVENPDLGILQYRYFLGKASTIRVDQNRDGLIDAKAEVNAPFGPYAPHTAVPVELWESSGLDGVFDRHTVFEAGEIRYLELDEDRDGHFERRLEAAAAKAFYSELERRNSLLKNL